jgi:hypothetical protein
VFNPLFIIIIIPSSHSINAIGPAPLRSGNKREHSSRMLQSNQSTVVAYRDLAAQHADLALMQASTRCQLHSPLHR